MEPNNIMEAKNYFRELDNQHGGSPGLHNSSMKNLYEWRWGVSYKVGSARIFPEQNCFLLPNNDYQHIRPKTFAVLVYLCERSETLVSKDQLINAIWGDVCVTDDSLVQCIVEIRRALGPDNGKYLRTVTRMGYVLHAELLHNKAVADNHPPNVLVGPFRSSTTGEQEHFAQGLCDNVTMQLLQNERLPLKVTSAESSPGADYHLLGSLLVQGIRTRATVQLLNLSTSQYIWAQRYEHTLEDPFALYDFLSQTIADDLIAKLIHIKTDNAKANS